jgi:two-component system OmpR family response regulator
VPDGNGQDRRHARGDVLLVSKEPLADLVSALSRRHIAVTGPLLESEVEAATKRTAFDCAVIDLRTPMDGAALAWLCRGLSTQALVITRADDAQVRIDALRSGAADHIVAPFDTDEAVARIEALVTRRRRLRRRVLEVGDLAISAHQRTVHRRGDAIVLTDRELALLMVLIGHRDEVVDKRQLLDELYPGQSRSLNLIEAHLSSLRRKLENSGPPLIHTVHGLGYTFRAVLPEPARSRVSLIAERDRLRRERDEAIARRDAIVAKVRNRRVPPR